MLKWTPTQNKIIAFFSVFITPHASLLFVFESSIPRHLFLFHLHSSLHFSQQSYNSLDFIPFRLPFLPYSLFLLSYNTSTFLSFFFYTFPFFISFFVRFIFLLLTFWFHIFFKLSYISLSTIILFISSSLSFFLLFHSSILILSI